jgi:hypothetical protein
MKNLMKKKIKEEKKEEISKAITYFTNHLEQMNYPLYLLQNIPIGSGVIEAACKVIIKQRMCNSGMRWTDEGAKNILVLILCVSVQYILQRLLQFPKGVTLI